MLKSVFSIILGLSISVSAEVIPDGFTKVKELGGITEYNMDSNGLTVLLQEDHSSPVTTLMVTYKVGSRNEVTGSTGSTHLLEHLMFKGTEKFNKANGGHIDATLGSIGARLNASTWLDRTNYFESIPSPNAIAANNKKFFCFVNSFSADTTLIRRKILNIQNKL